MSESSTVSEHGATIQSTPVREPTAVRTRVRAVGRDRDHHVPARARRLKLRLSPEELADVEAAARAAGLTPTGYAAEVAVATARHVEVPLTEPMRVALADLIEARVGLRRFGTNVHLAVASVHRGGEVPDWLEQAIRDTAGAVARVDNAAAAVAKALR